MTTELWAIAMVMSASLVGSAGPIFFKKASGKLKISLEALKNKWLLLGISSYALSTILFIPALKGGELSVLYPIAATTYIWVSIWSMKFLGEKMSKLKWLGILLVISGVLCIGLGI